MADMSLVAYKFEVDPDDECRVNTVMLERSIRAVETLSSKLSYIVLPSGTKVTFPTRETPVCFTSIALG
jgi:hypothetical protein